MNKVLRLDFQLQPSCSSTSIIWESPPSPLLIRHVKQKLKSMKVINNSCHIRFQEEIHGENVWLDIINEDVPCPGESSFHVKVKILQQFRIDSQAFFGDLFKGVKLSPSEYSDMLQSVRKNLLKNLDLKVEESSEEEYMEEPSEMNGNQFESNTTESFGYQQFNHNNTNKATHLNINDHIEFVDEEKQEEFAMEEHLEEHDNSPFADIDFGEPEETQPQKPSEDIDFLNGSGFPGGIENCQKGQSNSLGELDELISMGGSNKQEPKQRKASKSAGGLLDLDFGDSNKPLKSVVKDHHQTGIDERNTKLIFANEIDPIVKEWSKNSKTGTLKDIRSLLISLKSLLKKYKIDSENIMLSQIMSESAVKKMYFKVIRKIHPDKTREKDPKILYLFERVTEIVNEAYKKHKDLS